MWWASITCCGQAPSSWRLWPLSPVAVLTTAIVAVVERICLDLLRCCRVTGLRWHFANHIALPAFLFKKTFALACVFRSYLTGLTRLTTDGTRCFGRVAVCSPQRRPVLAKNAKNEEIQHGMHRTDTEVSFVVEDDAETWGAGDTTRKAYRSACITLTLGVLGSSILPIPFAISKTGVLVGCLTMVLVAWANDATSCMLIRAAAATGKPTYEALAEWAGGRSWKVFTQISLVLLLWGTMCGGLALISDVGYMLVNKLTTDQGITPPMWVNGRTCMTAVALFVLFPLCLQRHMRELEKAAAAGVVLVVCLVGLLATEAVNQRFPAIQAGELPLWSLKVDGHLPEAFAVVGYAFYMQPMMMPLLREMPEGPEGVRLMHKAVHTTLFGVALIIYFSMGLFGASLFGQDTVGNIMVNTLVTGRAATAALYGCMLLYLALGMTTTQYALRASLDLMVVGEDAPFTWFRQVGWTAITVGSSLAVALLVPDQAEKIYAVVGATAVCCVCYVVPVYIQLRMYQRRRRRDKALQAVDDEAPLSQPLVQEILAPGGAEDMGDVSNDANRRKRSRHRHGWLQAQEVLHEVVSPVAILLIGVGFSVAALYVAALPMISS